MALLMVFHVNQRSRNALRLRQRFHGADRGPADRPAYVPGMTRSELFVLMTSGFAHISGALMIGGTSIMARTRWQCSPRASWPARGSLDLAKLFMPETGQPATAGTVRTEEPKSPYVNGIDAAAAGTTDGLKLALNVAAMLIVFIAFVAMFDALLGMYLP